MSNKISFQDLVIEVTRRCNMHCAHCLRGEAQAVDLDLHKIDAFLEDVSHIDTITFTGGEPSLNVDAIRHVLDRCKELSIPVYNFYIVTNGKDITDAFLRVLMDWYVYCVLCGGEPEYSGLALSQDEYHEPINASHIALLRAFSFFNESDKSTDWSEARLINIGRARSITNHPKRDPRHSPASIMYIEDGGIRVEDGPVLFTCNGDILLDCDYEYESMDDVFVCDYTAAVDVFSKAFQSGGDCAELQLGA